MILAFGIMTPANFLWMDRNWPVGRDRISAVSEVQCQIKFEKMVPFGLQ